ncbi:MAG: hypothetical protein P1U53_04085 [Sulfitobacter sp.]|nr:hypothetical protein [Sulfitobacter sp.]
MTAFALKIATPGTPLNSIQEGTETGLFVAGSQPGGHDMMVGDGLDLYVCSCAPMGQDAMSGDATGLFVTSC